MSALRTFARPLPAALADLAALATALVLTPFGLMAQSEILSVTPTGGTYVDPDVTVQVTWCNGDAVPWEPDLPSHAFYLNGVDVTSSFSGTSSEWTQSCESAGDKSGTVTLSQDGNNVFQAEACDYQGCDTETVNLTYIEYPAPGVSALPHNDDYIDTKKCGATCFDHVLTYSTPAYVSLDQPRSVTLMHRSSQVFPHGFAQVDVEHPEGNPNPPDAMSIQIKDDAGSVVTLKNNNDEWFYASDPNDLTGRLSALWDMTAKPTGVYDYTVIVRSWWNPGQGLLGGEKFVEADPVPVRILVLNEEDSDFGAGWSMVGLQRIHEQADGSVLLAEGDGSAAFFAWNGTGYDTPPGDFSTLVANTGGLPWKRDYPDGSRVAFDGSGRMLWTQDRYGTRIEFSWASGKLDHIKDPADTAKEISFAYDGVGKLSAIEDPMGRRTEFTVNASGNLVEVKDATDTLALKIGYTTTGHRVSWFEDRAGERADYKYTLYNEAYKIILPTVTVGASTNVRPEIEHWGPRRRNTTQSSSAGTKTNLLVHRPVDHELYVDDARDKRTRFVLDRFRAPTRIVDAEDRQTTIWRNTHSQVVKTQRHSGFNETFTWSGPNLMASNGIKSVTYGYVTWTPSTNVTTTMLSTISGDGATRTFHYAPDAGLDSLVLGNGPDARTTAYTTDGFGRVISVTDPEGHTTTTTYASTGLRNRVSRADTIGTTQWRHDQYGRVRAAENALGQTDSVVQNLLNVPTKQIDAIGAESKFAYDAALRLTQVTDAIGNVYGFTRNALGWVTAKTDPRGQIKSFEFDRNGNVTRATNRRGQAVTFAYDAVDRVTQRIQLAENDTTSWTYDSSDMLVTIQHPASVDRIHTDPAGRVTKEETTRGSHIHAVHSSWEEDRRTEVELDPHAGPTRDIWYDWGLFNQLDKITDLAGTTTTFAYNDDLQRTSMLYGTGLQVTFAFPATHTTGLITMGATSAQSAELGRQYEFDALRRVVTETRGDTTTTSTAAMRTFTYDAAGRLVRHDDWTTQPGECEYYQYYGIYCEPDQSVPVDSVLYSWDPVGNPAHLAAVVDSANLLKTFGGFTMTYDADHNLLTKSKPAGPSYTYAWNSLGQLTQATRNDTITSFVYDGLGRRIGRVVDGAPVAYVWDGDDIAMEIDASGAAEAYYAYFPGMDRPHSVYRDGTNYHYVTDRRGNVTGLMEGGSTRRNTFRYQPFGTLESGSEETVSSAPRWGGAQYDESTDLYYMRARYYDANLQRFISEDPIGLEGGVNLFAFSDADPEWARDPSGLGTCIRGVNCESDKPWYRPPADTLDEELREKLGNMCDEIDCDRITIFDDGAGGFRIILSVNALSGRPFALGYGIFFLGFDSNNPAHIAQLAHEMTHVYQYETLGFITYFAHGIVNQGILYPLGVDVYGYAYGPPRSFGQYGLEQQGQIVRDCFGGNVSACAISPFGPNR